MKRIVLIRHGKSSWEDESLNDVDRPLNDRGRAACLLMGTWMADKGINPDHVWCSPAVRTVQTWERMALQLPDAPEGDSHNALYMASPSTMLSLIEATPKSADTVAIVGHQPGLSSLARKLADGSEKRKCRRAYEKYPTAAIAVLDVDVKRWDKVAYGKAHFTRFVTPKDLSGED